MSTSISSHSSDRRARNLSELSLRRPLWAEVPDCPSIQAEQIARRWRKR